MASGAVAQSLGEAAQKEKKRRESAAKAPKKVYGDDDLGRYEPQRTNEGGAQSRPAVSGEGTPSEGAGPGGALAQAVPGKDPQEPSDMDKLKAKIERWRSRYRPLKSRVEALEKKIADLEKQEREARAVLELRPGDPGYVGGGPPFPKSRSQLIQERLSQARFELAWAKKELAQIEEDARKDGVPAAQLD